MSWPSERDVRSANSLTKYPVKCVSFVSANYHLVQINTHKHTTPAAFGAFGIAGCSIIIASRPSNYVCVASKRRGPNK